MRVVEIATNRQGYRVHAGEVLKGHASDNNQATPAQYHVSGNNFNLDISHSYGSVIGNDCRHSIQRLQAKQCCCIIASWVYVPANHYYADIDLVTRT
jgi:hypothetical protein